MKTRIIADVIIKDGKGTKTVSHKMGIYKTKKELAKIKTHIKKFFKGTWFESYKLREEKVADK